MSHQAHSPLLFLIFNRPDLSRAVFARIREAQPARLYVAADGPRPNRPGEYEICAETRRVALAVDWPCSVKTLFREKNLGCGRAVSEAISWFFEQEPEGIILEDDCIPDNSFFKFCDEVLEKYRDEPRVMTIGGVFIGDGPHKSPQKRPDIDTSYFFSRHVMCWGWATWRRAWNLFDFKMTHWPQLRDTDWLQKISSGSRDFQKSWGKNFQSVYDGLIDTWDFQWIFSIWFQEGLSVLPAKNLVTNIGFEENGTHTKISNGFHDALPIESIDFPLRHPGLIEQNHAMDQWMDQLTVHIFAHQKRFTTLRRGLRWLAHKVPL